MMMEQKSTWKKVIEQLNKDEQETIRKVWRLQKLEAEKSRTQKSYRSYR